MEKVAKRSHSRQLVLWLMLIELLFFCSVSSAEFPFPARRILKHNGDNKHQRVQLKLGDRSVVIDNGLVEITIDNPSGYLTGIKYRGIDNVLESGNEHSNRGYWDIVHDDDDYDKLETKHVKVITQTDDVVEVSFSKKWDSGNRGTAPLNIDKRFIVRRGVPGIYMYGIFERKEDFPDSNMYQTRIAFKLNEDKFRFMAVSDTIQRIMPRAEDRDEKRSETLAFKEAVLLTNPSNQKFRGQVDDKYQYSMENKDNKLHGWISDDDAVGFWVITPSNEFRTGGPHKQDLTSHVGPVALSMFTSTHYTGTEIDVAFKKGEAWKKVFGPVLIYLNSDSGDDHRNKLWKDAKQQLREEIKSWPYNFVRSEDFPYAEQRGEVSGQLLVRDRYLGQKIIRADSAFVGLAAPGEAGSWQTEGKGYQFWTQTDKTGRFNIKHVRPGMYNLYAWVHGFIGTYKFHHNITIKPESKINLGAFIYDPPRNGPTLWEIGIPDRTAAEFFIPEPDPIFASSIFKDDANEYRQYGLWNRYSDIYRHGDLVYTVGVSNYSRDWFFAQVPRKVESDYKPTTWQVKFSLDDVKQAGNYTLQMALAAASYAEVQVNVNNHDEERPLFSTKRIGYDNAVARHGIHGLYKLYSINVPGSILQKGNNTIFLSQTRSQSPFLAVMYDYIRLEGPTV